MPNTAPVARVFLKPRHARPFFNKHPWVFAGAIDRIEGEAAAGTEVDLLSSEGEFVARGLYNPHSNIAVRLYWWKEPRRLDEPFWHERIRTAVQLRRRLFGDDWRERALRVVFSEGDWLSGLTVDYYDGWLVVQFTSLALWLRREQLLSALQEQLRPEGVWLRTEKGIREAEGLEVADGPLSGQQPPRPLFVEEQGVRWGIDLVEGQKTGFYLDQRDNRHAVAGLTAGRRVLDLFCYSGGFGITAAVRGGAKSVLGVDSSQAAVTLARANAELNGVADRCRFEKADVLKTLASLKEQGQRFDVVVLDPPKFARSRAGVANALKAYERLNAAALEVVEPDGLLVSCSCSGHVSREAFEQTLAAAATRAGRSLQILERRGQAADHPVNAHCLETGYLKCYVSRVI